jgi:hypothetical protein
MLVNLFEPSTGPAHGLKAIALQRSGRALVDIGLALGFDRRVAKDRVKVAIAYGHKLEDAGVTDPFVELTEPPANASRWRVHARFQSDATPAADKGEAA